MNPLLYLCHRIPYPPDKGDKIRSFHILEALCQRYEVHLGAFVDAPDDWHHVDALRQRVSSLHVLPLTRFRARLRSMQGFLTSQALTVPYFQNAAMLRWVRRLVESRPLAGALVYSSGMAQYLRGIPLPVKVMDFCDLDSDKWSQYAKGRPQPARWIYNREARLLACEEGRIAAEFDSCVFVSELESDLFRSMHPSQASRAMTVGNGVDTTYFDPAQVDRPVPSDLHLVFTGAMDYWANVDGVVWFVRDVWPQIRNRHRTARFSIVGSRPAAAVRELARYPGVEVTGRVPDVRPWLADAAAVVAPLRIARGVQNKVLEAMSMARPIVATSAALQGLGHPRLAQVAAADTPEEFAGAVERMLAAGSAPAHGNRQFVLDNFSWSAALRPLWSALERRA